MNDFSANGYSQLEIFARSLPDADGWVGMVQTEKGRGGRRKAGDGFFRRLVWPLDGEGRYSVWFKGCEISLAYLSGGPGLLDRGIAFLEPDPKSGALRPASLTALLAEPGRERYHFAAYKNWLNDPNGLCWFDGRYHMYYQYNPHAPRWGNPYWGHAVSRDLIHWVHLPVCLEPQGNLQGDKEHKGGAFSGSAIVQDGGLVFFLTRHRGPQQDSEATREWQVRVESPDSLRFGREKVVAHRPKGYSFHCRDPKVNRDGNGWHMYLGSCGELGPCILHYLSGDGMRWKKQKDLLCDAQHPGTTTLECPDVFSLNGQWVATASLMDYQDPQGRRQPTWYYVGALKEGRMEVLASGLFDFGTNLYAVQTFVRGDRRIAIGWIADTYQEHQEKLSSALGSMSLPRELTIKNSRLYVRPAREVYSLLGPIAAASKGRNLPELPMPGNAFYVRVEFAEDTQFDLLLGRSGGATIRLTRKQETALRLCGTKTETVAFVAPVSSVRVLEIFVDRRTVEVFVNEGEAAGTKLFYSATTNGIFSAAFSAPTAVSGLTVRRIEDRAILTP